MKRLLLKNAALALVVAAVAAPLAGAATSYDGYKSSYPQLHTTLSGHVPVAAKVAGAATSYDGYKSSYPQLHATLGAHVVPVPSRGFDWRDASVGAGTAAGLIILLAAAALLLMRRRSRFSIKAIFGLLLSVVAAAVFAVASSAEKNGATVRSGDLQVTKECTQYSGGAGSFCTITSSNLNAIKVGSRVVYTSAVGDPTPGLLNSDLVIDGPGNNTAFGHVVLDLSTLSGVVTFSGGTGEFTHFHAGPLVVACPAYPVCSWAGPYGFSPPA
jgi:hypothetical protein